MIAGCSIRLSTPPRDSAKANNFTRSRTVRAASISINIKRYHTPNPLICALASACCGWLFKPDKRPFERADDFRETQQLVGHFPYCIRTPRVFIPRNTNHESKGSHTGQWSFEGEELVVDAFIVSHDRSTNDVAVSIDKLRERMIGNISPQHHRILKMGRHKSVVDYTERIGFFCERGNSSNITDF